MPAQGRHACIAPSTLYKPAPSLPGGDGLLPAMPTRHGGAGPSPVRGGDKPEGVCMPLYECVFIARNDVTQQQVETIADGIGAQLDADKGIVAPPPAEGEAEGPRQSASVMKREYWGLRSLAYRIKKNRKGHYMLLGIDAVPASVLEMERQLRLNEDVLRFMTLRVDAIEEGQSAILSRK